MVRTPLLQRYCRNLRVLPLFPRETLAISHSRGVDSRLATSGLLARLAVTGGEECDKAWCGKVVWLTFYH